MIFMNVLEIYNKYDVHIQSVKSNEAKRWLKRQQWRQWYIYQICSFTSSHILLLVMIMSDKKELSSIHDYYSGYA